MRLVEENTNMLIAYQVSLDLIRNLATIEPTIKRFDRDLADQLHRAAQSVCLNLGEGTRNSAGNQRQRYESAHGSAAEVKAALEVAIAWGYVEDPKTTFQILDRLLGLLWGLTHVRARAKSG